MNKNQFQVSINDSKTIPLNSKDIEQLDILKIEDLKYHILHHHKSYKAEITEANFDSKIYKLRVNNNNYNIHIINDLDVLIKEMGFDIGTSTKVNEIKAPMPGLILDVNVKIGQLVKEDDVLLILEAMKMENILIAPRDGIIKSISANKGDAVDKNQLLVEFE